MYDVVSESAEFKTEYVVVLRRKQILGEESVIEKSDLGEKMMEDERY